MLCPFLCEKKKKQTTHDTWWFPPLSIQYVPFSKHGPSRPRESHPLKVQAPCFPLNTSKQHPNGPTLSCLLHPALDLHPPRPVVLNPRSPTRVEQTPPHLHTPPSPIPATFPKLSPMHVSLICHMIFPRRQGGAIPNTLVFFKTIRALSLHSIVNKR